MVTHSIIFCKNRSNLTHNASFNLFAVFGTLDCPERRACYVSNKVSTSHFVVGKVPGRTKKARVIAHPARTSNP